MNYTQKIAAQQIEIDQLREESSRYREALERIAGDSQPNAMLSPKTWDAWQALNPEPEYVEEEVVRWMCEECGYIYPNEVTTCPKCFGPSHKGVLKLTGTRRVPKPKKVKRREEILINSPMHWVWKDATQARSTPPNSKFYIAELS